MSSDNDVKQVGKKTIKSKFVTMCIRESRCLGGAELFTVGEHDTLVWYVFTFLWDVLDN